MVTLYRDKSWYQGSKNISMICKYLVSWVKKTSLTKKVATLLFKIFLFPLCIRKFVNSLLNYPQKISLQNFKLLFPLILWIFDLECHGQSSLKVAFVKFAHVFWNLENWKASTWKTKNSIAIKQKQPPEVFCKKKCSQKFGKIHKKTPVLESPF